MQEWIQPSESKRKRNKRSHDCCSNNHTHKCFFSSYLVVIEVTVDGKSVPSDSPLVAGRPSPAPSQYTSITFGSKKLSGDVTRLCQENAEDEEEEQVTISHNGSFWSRTFFFFMVLCCAVARVVLWGRHFHLRWSLRSLFLTLLTGKQLQRNRRILIKKIKT